MYCHSVITDKMSVKFGYLPKCQYICNMKRVVLNDELYTVGQPVWCIGIDEKTGRVSVEMTTIRKWDDRRNRCEVRLDAEMSAELSITGRYESGVAYNRHNEFWICNRRNKMMLDARVAEMNRKKGL